MMLRIFILGWITAIWAASTREPDCYSRFDYEYKVVQKLIELENAQKEQVQINKDQLERIKALEMDIEMANRTAQEKTSTLKKSLDEVLETNNEMKAALEEANNKNKNITVEVENIKRSKQHRGDIIILIYLVFFIFVMILILFKIINSIILKIHFICFWEDFFLLPPSAIENKTISS